MVQEIQTAECVGGAQGDSDMIVEDVTTIKVVRITPEGRDPITVTIDDFSPGKGQLSLSCFGLGWAHHWNAIGQRGLVQFILACDNDYLAGKLHHGPEYEFDLEGTRAALRKKIIEARRNDGINAEEARIHFDSVGELWQEDLMFGELAETYDVSQLERPTREYNYLRQIVSDVKKGLTIWRERNPE